MTLVRRVHVIISIQKRLAKLILGNLQYRARGQKIRRYIKILNIINIYIAMAITITIGVQLDEVLSEESIQY